MKRLRNVVAVVGLTLIASGLTDAERINRHPGAPYQGEKSDGQMVETLDVAGSGAGVYYGLIDPGGSPVATATLRNCGSDSAYRWMDVANQNYSTAYQNSYSYDDARVLVTYNTVGRQLTGMLVAVGLKPNFAYQLKLQAEPTHTLGDTNYGTSELLGLSGRWWQQKWQGNSWNVGWNLNNKGNGSSPNPNDDTYYERRDITDDLGGSPTGLRYKYTAYRVFEYFIADDNGNAALSYVVNNSYHVLWKTSQQSPFSGDGPVVTYNFNVDPLVHLQYDTDYPAQTAGIFAEWERLPRDGIGLPAGDYSCDILLTEESFHGNGGLEGSWADAMKASVQFTILPADVCAEPIKGDLNDDCRVDLQDLAILASVWMKCNLDPNDAYYE